MQTFTTGLRVGHAQDYDACTGCTVLLGPFRGAVDVRGLATGTRELDVFSPLHLVDRIDALVLTGGSAFGLAAADGVAAWLAERDIGFETPVARVPIVPAAVIFDLGVGSPHIRPDAAMGRAACDAASEHVRVGRIGAGTGASAGKLLGPAGATRTGLGVAHGTAAGFHVDAIAVANPLGDILNADGSVLAGPRSAAGERLDSRVLLSQTPAAPWAAAAGTNTTLVAVITDAPLSRADLARMVRVAATGVARRIAPVNTPFDGDVVFALSTSPDVQAVDLASLLAVSSCAATTIERAIERAATAHEENR